LVRGGEGKETGMKARGRKTGLTHVEGFKVFADFGDELFTALVALREAFIWCICLGESEEREGGACEGEEMTDILCGWRAWLCGVAGSRELTFSTLPRSCIWRAVRDEDQIGSAS
jgi:hypothetical protein